MTGNDQLDVLIAVYLIPELAQQDYDGFVKLVGEGTISTDGVVLVTKDADGEVTVQETGDHMGRKGAKAGGGVGLVVGLVRAAVARGDGGRSGGGRNSRQGRTQARRGGDRREDGRRAAARHGRGHLGLRPR